MSERVAGGPLRVLVVGLGSIGQRHVRNLRALPGDRIEITAVRARGRTHVLTDRQTVEAETGLVERYGIRVVPDLTAALAERPAAVFVTNPTRLHLDVARAAAEAGCHLFVEKPLADCEEGLQELVDVVERRGLVALVGYQIRFHPAFEHLKALLAQGRPGRVIGVRAAAGESLRDAHPYEDYRESYAARRELGGGVLLGLSHELDYLNALFGLPQVVFAGGGRLSRLELDVEDTASVLLELAGPSHRFPAHVHLDYLQQPPVRTCEIFGDDGRIVWDYHAGTVDDVRRDGRTERFSASIERTALFEAELRHFVRCLRGEERPRVTLRDGAAAVRVALAARRSMEAGVPVRLAPA